MVRRVFLKLWLALTAVLLAFAVAAFIFIRVEAYPATDSNFQLGWPILITFLLAWALVTLLCMLTARRFSRSEAATIEFAGRLASGQFDVSIDRREAGDADTIEALNGASASLGQMYRALETSRRELTALLDSMEEAVIAISPDGQVSWSNAVFEEISQSPVRYGRALVHTIRDPDVLDAVERALRDREVCKGRATSVAAGRVFQVNVAPTPGGGAVLVLHDVTKVEQAEVSRRDFVANVSHELRTPLTSISGYVETLIESRGLREEQTKEFLSVILKNASRMHRLTEDLLALARVESKDYSLTPQASRASVLVVDAIESLAPLAIDAGLDLLPGSMVEDQVMADPDALQQVFGNLIENAIKYGKQGGRIVVGCRRVGENVEFFVQDYGAGIASHHLSRLFERFYRVDTARSRESGGTGLGLAIVKRILEAHRGDIWVESEVGQGTAFLFRLPAIEHAREAERAAETIPDVIASQEKAPQQSTSSAPFPGLENVAASGPRSV
jgi:two-component system phosphate regulon sensor histidine kinase PhoR